MADFDYMKSLVASATAPALFVGIAFANDAVLSKSASETITAAIRGATSPGQSQQALAAVERALDQNFPSKGQPGTFLINVIALTLASLLCVLLLYCTKMPGLIDQLLTPGFLKQFVGNGILVTLAVNAVAYRQYRHLLSQLSQGSGFRSWLWVAADTCLKALLFIGLTALVYVAFALTTSAFRGDVGSALRAVPITIREALFFRNLTGVYIYSLALSSFPIYLAVIVQMFVLRPHFAAAVQKVIFFLPIAEKPVRAAALVFFLFSSLLITALAVFVIPLAESAAR
jgi:hypothetical protein